MNNGEQDSNLQKMQIPPVEELLERLEAVQSAKPEWHDGPVTCWHRNPDGPEAAALIRQYQARIEALEEGLSARLRKEPTLEFIGLTRLPDQPVGERKFVPTVKQPTDIVITTRVKHG